jgi:glutaredoxin
MSRNAVAQLYRMVMPDHVCPYGIKSRWLLRRQGYTVDDHPLRSRSETDEFKAEVGVKTTPQTFIDGERIGGYDALRQYFGMSSANDDAPTDSPVIAIFGTCALAALAMSWAALGSVLTLRAIE